MFMMDAISTVHSLSSVRLQNGAARRILQVDRYTPSAYTHEEMHMEFLDIRRKKHTWIMIYKILNDLVPQNVNDN